MAKLGYVGLGVMGGQMTARLLDKGHSVIGHNRTKSKAQWLIDKGMQWADSPYEVAAAADITFSMVTDSVALEKIASGEDGYLAGLGPGKILVDMSTISPATSRGLAARVRERGADMVDAPVSSAASSLCSKASCRLWSAAAPATFDLLKPVLLDIGAKATHVGDNGLALVMKIATNLSLVVQMLAFSEGVLLAEKSGISREIAVDALTHSAIASPMVQYRGPFVLNMPDEAWFNVNMMQKDMLLAFELGRQLNVPLPTSAAANEYLTAARGMGLQEKDFAIVFEVLARMSGVSK